MAATTGRTSRLTDEQLGKMLELAGASDSVELKLTVPPSERRATVEAIGFDAIACQIRQVFFFDTPELALQKAGLAVRARRVQGREGDTVVKLRPVVPADLPDYLRRSRSMVVEVDAMPGGYVCSAALKGRLDNEQIRATVTRGEGRLRKLFSKEQRRFYLDHAPEGVDLDTLSVLGPIFVLKANVVPKGLGRKLVGELWMYPDNSQIIELSTKCVPSESLEVALKTRLFLEGKGIDLGAEQETKTRRALEFFAAELAAAAG
ncbi:MAG: hypothetical protein U0R69_07510 [Gaiellales bacterium]